MNDADILDEKIQQIKTMNGPALKTMWKELYFREAPLIHPRLLRMRLIWRVQEIMNGGLSHKATDELSVLRKRMHKGKIRSKKLQDDLPIGTRLMREYGDECHEVLVVKDGFEYRGSLYKNLSRIAKIITGTPWNGPLFFGLRKNSDEKK